MPKILVADDHILVRTGMKLLIREILGVNSNIDFASDGKEVINRLSEQHFDILITDVNMPDTDGLELVASSLVIQPKLRILVVSINNDEIFAQRFLKIGAFGYIQKGNSDDDLKRAIYEISLGRRFITVNQAQQFTNAFLNGTTSNPFDKLSGREFEVALLLLKGNGVLEIANALSINISTASTYKGRVFEKLEIKNLIELTNLARRYQVVVDE